MSGFYSFEDRLFLATATITMSNLLMAFILFTNELAQLMLLMRNSVSSTECVYMVTLPMVARLNDIKITKEFP